ncbi:MAG: aminodeoxychorismate synthase component I [Eubacteriales bacterium]|nr:aminodeoxychorismate synthase component I [Eubacteriales bacterium]
MQLIQEFDNYPPIHRIFALVHDKEDSVFLDSSLQNQLGRYSIIALHPYLKLVNGEQFTVNGKPSEESFEAYVKKYLRTHQEKNTASLPLVSGAVGYFSYDYGREKERVKAQYEKDVDIPDCILIFYDSFIIEDHENHRLSLVANGHGQDCDAGMEILLSLVYRAKALESQGNQSPADENSAVSVREESFPDPAQGLKSNITAVHRYPLESAAAAVTANFTKEDYKDAVRRMIQYIVEGDIYIANMTQQLQITSSMPPYEMFERLRTANPSPFGGYFNYGSFQVVCASPERFLQMRNRKIQTRPIKGTRKRGSTPEEDAALRRELELSEKDKSELLMIVDLERNDLNRVCVPGSVKVTELFTVEAYATVFHLISNIVGELRPELTVMDLLEAAFPGGSITGAPKLRAMELIDELEHGRRNLYTGSMGYLSLDGDCDFNIVIRTALYKDGMYYLGAGGGITYESDLEFEYEETIQKARALLDALGCL